MRAQLEWVVGLNTFEICIMNENGTYIELDPSAMRLAGVGPSMIQRSEDLDTWMLNWDGSERSRESQPRGARDQRLNEMVGKPMQEDYPQLSPSLTLPLLPA